MMKGYHEGGGCGRRSLLLDDWFDAIEDGIRARARRLSRRCWRRNFPRRCRVRAMVGASRVRTRRAPSVVGVRHGHRERTLTGTFGKTRIAVPRAPVDRRGRQDAHPNGGAVRCAPTNAAPGPPTP